MDQFQALHPPQDPKRPRKKLKTIFSDDTITVWKCRAFLQLYQDWQNRDQSRRAEPPPFPAQIAEKLKLSEVSLNPEADAAEIMEFALSPYYGEFELEYIRSYPHTTLDLNGDEIPRPFDPVGW
jgi:hypothetical protein